MSRVIGRQRGATLLIALVMLLLLSLLAASSMRQTLLQARSGGAALENTQAFNAAEAALREGERRLVAVSRQPDFIAFSSGFSNCTESNNSLALPLKSAFPDDSKPQLCILSKNFDLSTSSLTQSWALAALQPAGTDRAISYKGSDGKAKFNGYLSWAVTVIGSSSVDVSKPTSNLFRVTAVAKNAEGRFPVILQSIVALEVP
ncbi:pilus assembly PilX family protein [Pseudomonas oryzihabitans]|uniref:pilus assembly PilX family protein n=1 Tax=Pseudomonas oryzihabitans TaxID=47885 RepID=UPI000ED7D54A|nr:PilX N-terminal domain-containing pilus assembly protein [Pseudomonas oryzihabitans]HCV77663.1 hypothetical protein [Pseudomonas sp.]